MAHNTSGFCGVYWEKGIQKWAAQIIVNGQRHFLGAHPTKEAAILARQEADVRFGFSRGHGKPKSADYPSYRDRRARTRASEKHRTCINLDEKGKSK
jgi:hypothetical protein